MNHVFLFQVHKDSVLIKRILKRLESPNHFFVINVDGKSNEKREILSSINSISNVILITEDRIAHGGFSFASCTINQIKFCYEQEIHFDYYHTCSGQDYPCVSNGLFDAFFSKASTSYMLMDTPELAEKWRKDKYRKRLERFYFVDQCCGNIATRTHLNGIVSRLLISVKRPCSFLPIIWGGWNWFSITDECIGYLLNYFNDHPDFLERFKYTLAADELIFSTILYYKRKELNIETGNSLRYVEWNPSREYEGGLPLILDERDYEDIVHSGAFFCRKVEGEYSEKLLDMLDKRIEKMSDTDILMQNPKHP